MVPAQLEGDGGTVLVPAHLLQVLGFRGAYGLVAAPS
jgi:hypothetical protein